MAHQKENAAQSSPYRQISYKGFINGEFLSEFYFFIFKSGHSFRRGPPNFCVSQIQLLETRRGLFTSARWVGLNINGLIIFLTISKFSILGTEVWILCRLSVWQLFSIHEHMVIINISLWTQAELFIYRKTRLSQRNISDLHTEDITYVPQY